MDNVPEIREALRSGRDIPLLVYCDNAYTFWEKNDFVIWDDTNERVIVYRLNDDPQSSPKLPLNVTVTDYDHIQKMEVRITVEALPDVVDSLATISPITDDQRNAILHGQLITVDDRFFGSKRNKHKIAIAEREEASTEGNQ